MILPRAHLYILQEIWPRIQDCQEAGMSLIRLPQQLKPSYLTIIIVWIYGTN